MVPVALSGGARGSLSRRPFSECLSLLNFSVKSNLEFLCERDCVERPYIRSHCGSVTSH